MFTEYERRFGKSKFKKKLQYSMFQLLLWFQSKSEVRTLAHEFAPEVEEGSKISALQAKSIFSQVAVSSSMNPFASGKEAAASLNPFATKEKESKNPFD